MTAIGDRLPESVFDMTTTRIVAGAIATHDYMPVHHDKAYAITQGAPDIFMNIMSTNAWCSRYLTDWGGPDAMLRKLSIRLGVPVFAGSSLTFTGEVTDVRDHDGESTLDVSFIASTAMGVHATGTATLSVCLR